MYGAAMYGMYVVFPIAVLKNLAPQPACEVVFWTLLAAQGTWLASIAWRRTGLPFATTSLAIVGVMSATMVVLAALGQADSVRVQLIGGGVVVATVFACDFAESRVHPVEWKKCRAHAERMTVWDILAGRHIPYLRHHDNGDDEFASRG